MNDPAKLRHLTAAALLALALAGCTTTGNPDDRASRLITSPDKFVLYNCDAIAGLMKISLAREKELERLIAKAGQGPDGVLVATVAYRPEYLSVHGDINELRAASAAKNCKAGRAPAKAGGRSSETIDR
ncbi:MAG: hypothetical protein WDN48_11945 [Pseudolabrys sp.]